MKTRATQKARGGQLEEPFPEPTPSSAAMIALEERIAKLSDLIDQAESVVLKERGMEKRKWLMESLQEARDAHHGGPAICPQCSGAEMAYEAFITRKPVRGCVMHSLWQIRILALFSN